MKINFHRKQLLPLAFFCMLLAACGEKYTEDESNQTDKPGETEPTGQGGFSQKLGAGGESGDALPLTGRAFGNLSVAGEEDAVYCNLPENVTTWDTVVPVCADPLYGILYYVDYGGDYMIHAVYNGEVQTVVELPGRRLFCRGGKLYFLLEDYNQFSFEGAKSGNLAEYDPVDGTVKILSEQQFTSMVVYQDVIYSKLRGESENLDDMYLEAEEHWFYFFDTGSWEQKKIEKDYALDFQRCGEYFMAATLEQSKDDPRYSVRTGMELRSVDGERGTVWEGLQPKHAYYIKDGGIHWMDQDGFHIWDIASEQDKISLKNYGGKELQDILRGDQYFSTGQWIFDRKTETCSKWKSLDETLKKVYEFYTDGDAVYAIAGPAVSEVNKNSVLRRVQVVQGIESFDYEAGGAEEIVAGLKFLPMGK